LSAEAQRAKVDYKMDRKPVGFRLCRLGGGVYLKPNSAGSAMPGF
jgi:hypothetical protein